MSLSAAATPSMSFGRSLEQMKKSFFDPETVVVGMEKGTYKALSKFGAFVRTTARQSIQYIEKPSKPGQPAHGHRSTFRRKTSKKTGVGKVQAVSPLRDFLFFFYDKSIRSVAIGPAKTNQKNAFGNKPIPEILEYGGKIELHEHLHRFRDGTERWFRTDLRYRLSGTSYRSAVGKPRRIRLASIAPRPTMQLALANELPKLEGMFQDCM